MRKFSVTEDTLLDSNLCLILTANIDEISLGERLYLKDLKYFNDDPNYNMLIKRFYSNVIEISDDIIKKFLITFINSKYKFVLYEEKELLGQEITINKKDLMNELIDFLIFANTNISIFKEEDDEN